MLNDAMKIVIMLGVMKLSVIVLNGVRLSVVAPSVLQLNVTFKEIEKKVYSNIWKLSESE